MKNYEELTLNGDDFASLRNDFDCMIQKLLLMMQQNNSEEGTINVKATISTVPARVDLGDGNVEEVFKPIITHKIEYTVPVKGSKSGMHDTGKKNCVQQGFAGICFAVYAGFAVLFLR